MSRRKVSQSQDLRNEVAAMMPQVLGMSVGVENISHGQHLPGGPTPRGAILGVHPVRDANVETVPPPAKKARLVLRVPSHSGWFRWDKIHPLERRGVPDFFTKPAASEPSTAPGGGPVSGPAKSLRSPALYKEYRDAMLMMYCNLKPTDPPLTFTQVRRCLVGDITSLRRIFDFLDHWGLINGDRSLRPSGLPYPLPFQSAPPPPTPSADPALASSATPASAPSTAAPVPSATAEAAPPLGTSDLGPAAAAGLAGLPVEPALWPLVLPLDSDLAAKAGLARVVQPELLTPSSLIFDFHKGEQAVQDAGAGAPAGVVAGTGASAGVAAPAGEGAGAAAADGTGAPAAGGSSGTVDAGRAEQQPLAGAPEAAGGAAGEGAGDAGAAAAAAAEGAADDKAGVLVARGAALRAAELALRGLASEACCCVCGAECTELRYRHRKQFAKVVCPPCFADGRLPPPSVSSDFVRFAAHPVGSFAGASAIVAGDASEEDPEEWSEEEVLLLLEGVEKHGDNWAEVAAHVGTKDRLQCVQYFVRMPIEDAFLRADTTGQKPPAGFTQREAMGAGEGGPAEAAAGGAGGSRKRQAGAGSSAEEGVWGTEVMGATQPVPFADAGNPIMAQVAFLSRIAGPRVAAAAAQAALAALVFEEPGFLPELMQAPPAGAEDPAVKPATPSPADAKPQGAAGGEEGEAAGAGAGTKAYAGNRMEGGIGPSAAGGALPAAVAAAGFPIAGGSNEAEQLTSKAAAAGGGGDTAAEPDGATAAAAKEAEEKQQLLEGEEMAAMEEDLERALGEAEGEESGGKEGDGEGEEGLEADGGDGADQQDGAGEQGVQPMQTDGLPPTQEAAAAAPPPPPPAAAPPAAAAAPAPLQPISALRMRAAAATALAAAAVKAKLMAEEEERHIRALVATIIHKQCERVELKLQQIEHFEELMAKERASLDQQRAQLFVERQRLTQELQAAAKGTEGGKA